MKPLDEFSIRIGKFRQPFGLGIPEHVVVTRKGLGWDQGTEPYAFEFGYSGEKFSAFFSRQLGRESGVNLRVGKNFEKAVVGLSYFYGETDKGNRHVFGPWWTVGVSSKLTILGELDFQPVPGKRFGFGNYLKADFELFRGLHLFATQEFSKWELAKDVSKVEVYGIGATWFPRPHYELSLFAQKQRALVESGDFADFIGFLAHIWL